MSAQELFDAVYGRDHVRLQQLLADARAPAWLKARDDNGLTPLAAAVGAARADSALVEDLIRAGSAINAQINTPLGESVSVLSIALKAGDPATVRALLDAGADLHYSREGYGALIDAVHGRDVHGDSRLLELLALLVERGAALDDITRYNESAVRVLSRLGRFDALALLLEAGASDAPLQWTPLMRTVAFGPVADIATALANEADPEARDSWSRTAWHIAVLSGDVERTDALRKGGVDMNVTGHCGQTSLHYAVDSGEQLMLDYLLAYGADPKSVDQHGKSAAYHAADSGKLAALRLLMDAGADSVIVRPSARPGDLLKLFGQESLPGELPVPDEAVDLLRDVTDPSIAAYLLGRGANPASLNFEARRGLVGLPPEPSARLLLADAQAYAAQRYRQFGEANPQLMNHPFWLDMIRSGVTGYEATMKLARKGDRPKEAVWCAQRFGQSLTFLPDGRRIQIAGEHEDSYDPDFCIYNDVFVHSPDGSIDIYGYPQDVFPPTDFHTATLVGTQIYVIGSLGYSGRRLFGYTLVFALDTQTMAMRRVDTYGYMPGWIYSHRTIVHKDGGLLVSGGKVAREQGGEEVHVPNTHEYLLDLTTLAWSCLG